MLEILLIVAFTFAVIYSLLGFSDESLWLKEAFTRGCTDNHLEGIFRNYEVIVDSNFYLFLLLLVVCIVLIIINISYFVIRVKYGDLK